MKDTLPIDSTDEGNDICVNNKHFLKAPLSIETNEFGSTKSFKFSQYLKASFFIVFIEEGFSNVIRE